jgi:hypothetical protein
MPFQRPAGLAVSAEHMEIASSKAVRQILGVEAGDKICYEVAQDARAWS